MDISILENGLDYLGSELSSSGIWQEIERTEPECFDGSCHFTYPDFGFNLLFQCGERACILDSIMYFCASWRHNECNRPYPGKLPMSLSQDLTEAQVDELLGAPILTGGGYPHDLLGFLYRWRKYEVEDSRYLHVSFFHDGLWEVHATIFNAE